MSDTDTTIRPALTPEAWRLRQYGNHYITRSALFVSSEVDSAILRGAERHAVAALALYGQPFGFTHEDVAELREAVAYYGEHRTGPESDLIDASQARLSRLADRLAALLPPETP